MSGRNAMVFGGSRGIGAAVSTRLAKDGFALTYVSHADKRLKSCRRSRAPLQLGGGLDRRIRLVGAGPVPDLVGVWMISKASLDLPGVP
jgi:NAD(P)-dependent dehydrogenase (short-subunit alcohol dehydrogenase family)